MSGSFSGFSEEDIQKLNSSSTTNYDYQRKLKGIKPLKHEKLNLSKQLKNEETTHLVCETEKDKPALEPISDTTHNDTTAKTILPSLLTTTNSHNDAVESPVQDVPEVLRSPSPIINTKLSLELLQARQKLIEEQNRKRKELLSKALADKTKKTLLEAQKLKEIEIEFKKLDSINSSDINVLRKQIELASIDYMEAEKYYFKMEREYLNSKLQLHLRGERKELLTEHLCTIIEKNEERKAQKLNEMLSQLNLHEQLDFNKIEESNISKE